MYTLDELSHITKIGKSILQRYRTIGVLCDKTEIRTYNNKLTGGLSKKKIKVSYS